MILTEFLFRRIGAGRVMAGGMKTKQVSMLNQCLGLKPGRYNDLSK